MNISKRSALTHLLLGLIPYTRQNLALSFMPKQFFHELSKESGYSEKTLRTTYYRARKARMITPDSVPRLTVRGKLHIQPYVAKQLGPSATLMVIFDIPEEIAELRRQFRNVLRRLEFQQVQQSVWMTSYDHKDPVAAVVSEFDIAKYVQIYEAVRIDQI